MFKYKIPISNLTEPDERRMSDLSDWAPSVTYSIDIQVGGFSLPFQIWIFMEIFRKDALQVCLVHFLIFFSYLSFQNSNYGCHMLLC